MRFISDYRRDLFCAKQKQDNICLDKQRFCNFQKWAEKDAKVNRPFINNNDTESAN